MVKYFSRFTRIYLAKPSKKSPITGRFFDAIIHLSKSKYVYSILRRDMKFKEDAVVEALYKVIGLGGNVLVVVGVLTILFSIFTTVPAVASNSGALVAQSVIYGILGIFGLSIGSSLKTIQNKMIDRGQK